MATKTELDFTQECVAEFREERKREKADAARFRKLMDLAAHGTWQAKPGAEIQHVWRFRPIMGPHANLLDAIDHMGET
jgi:hypothetical protein